MAALAWSAGAALYAAYPLLDPGSFMWPGAAAFGASAVIPPLAVLAWVRSRWNGASVAVWTTVVIALLSWASLLRWPVIGFLPDHVFLFIGPAVVWWAWRRPDVVLVGAAVPIAFLLAMLLAAGINPAAFVLLPATAVIAGAWLALAWHTTATCLAGRRPA